MDEVITHALKKLFNAYRQSAEAKMPLSPIAHSYKIPVMELFHQLREREFIKPDATVDLKRQEVFVGISTMGIRAFKPEYLNDQISKVLKGIEGNTGNVMAILNLPPSEFQRGFDLALEIQNCDYAKLLYANYNASLIVIELSLIGKQKISNG
jgi:hypothetical protein